MDGSAAEQDRPLAPYPGRAARLLIAAALLVGGPILAPAPVSGATFSNATPIVSPLPGPPPGCPTRCPSDRAAPYPSAIAVGGQSGTVTDVNVTLRDLTYEQNGPADADVMLVAPGGKSVMLMSDACGNNDNAHPITSPVTFTFDDQAGAGLPADAACASGTFKPVDDDDGEFPFHEPDEFPGGPAPATTAQLSSLNGISPNGSWSLYMVDDYPNDPDPNGRAGQIGGGWSIDISTSAAPAPAPPPPAPAPNPAPAPTPTPPPATLPPLDTTVPPPPGPEVTEPPAATPGRPGDFKPLASDTEEDGGDIVPWVVGGFLGAGALGLMAMLRPGGWRFWRR